jgi:nucleotide-binding universal stress UspA family protein
MYMSILVPVDLQETALTERAIQVARDIADHYSAAITVLTVIPDFGMPMVANFFPADAMTKARKEVEAELERYVAARFKDASKVRSRVVDGSPHKEIVEYAETHDTDLIVLPARAKDISKVFLGSSSTHVAERAPCSVLIVRP